MFTRCWFSIRYTMVEKPLYIFKRFSNGCSTAVKSSSNRYHLGKSITYHIHKSSQSHYHGRTHRSHTVITVPSQPHDHGRTHCNHTTMVVLTATTWSWPYPLHPHDHDRTHCNHMIMTVPIATTQP